MKKLERVISTVLLLSITLLSLCLPGSRQLAFAQGRADLWINPADLQIPAGATGRNLVMLDAAGNEVAGVEFTIDFDPEVVQVVDADRDTPGVQIELGDCFRGRDYFEGRNWVNNDAGRIEFAATLYQPAFPITGRCFAAGIVWRASVAGWSNVRFVDAQLVNFEGEEIPFDIEDGQVGGDTRPPICGRVLLQGRADDSLEDTFVALSEEPCLPSIQSAESAQVLPQQIIDPIPDMPSVLTDRNGCFTITPYERHDYRCLTVFQSGYLIGQRALPRGGFTDAENLGDIRLLGGDVDENDVVNIFDLVRVAGDFGDTGQDIVTDINADGRVDIVDLTITAGNFGTCGPLSTWEQPGTCPCP